MLSKPLQITICQVFKSQKWNLESKIQVYNFIIIIIIQPTHHTQQSIVILKPQQ